MLTWISPETTGNAISLTVSDRMRALQETAMNKKDRQEMEAHGITCAPRNVYSYKGFRYERLDDAVRYAVIDSKRIRNGGAD